MLFALLCVLGLWLLFFFVFASLFVAQLTAYYVNDRLYKPVYAYEPFSTVEELSSQAETIFGSLQGTR